IQGRVREANVRCARLPGSAVSRSRDSRFRVQASDRARSRSRLRHGEPMKASSKLVLALCSLLAACGSETKGGVDAGEEDTGTMMDQCTDDSPCMVTIGTPMSDYIAPMGDNDAWLFDVPNAGAIVQVAVYNDADFSPIRLEAVLFDPKGNAMKSDRFQGNGKQ